MIDLGNRIFMLCPEIRMSHTALTYVFEESGVALGENPTLYLSWGSEKDFLRLCLEDSGWAKTRTKMLPHHGDLWFIAGSDAVILGYLGD